MSFEAITVTIISSLLSGIIGVGVTVFVTYKLERHKLKLDLARRILGHRYEITGHGFSCAMNEVLAVFSDNPTVLQKMENYLKCFKLLGSLMQIAH